jgi:hypothetical protein
LRTMIAASAAALVLGGCAHSYESRIRGNLIEAGLSRPVATCMAQRMVDQLSSQQLRDISRLAGLGERNVRQMTVEEFLRRARPLIDRRAYEVIARAGLGCAIAS